MGSASHQDLVLGCLLGWLVGCRTWLLEALSREFRESLPMKLLHVDDFVLIAETKEL